MREHKFLKHLREDHAEQKKRGKKLIEARGPQERSQLRKQLHESLYPHMVGEEVSIFQRITQAADEEVRDDGLEGLQEHHVAKIVLREIMDLDPESKIFKAKSKVLVELNKHHTEEEERKIFKHLRKLCDDQELDRLFEQYEKGEKGAKS